MTNLDKRLKIKIPEIVFDMQFPKLKQSFDFLPVVLPATLLIILLLWTTLKMTTLLASY